jgi:hypothetical protein
MNGYEGPQDTLIHAVVTPALRVAWARRRCWHGETVGIDVRTECFKSGQADLKLTIQDSDGTVIDDVNLKVKDPGLLHNYDVKWKDKEPLLSAERYRFTVKAQIAAYGLEALSEPLEVDVEPPLLSA